MMNNDKVYRGYFNRVMTREHNETWGYLTDNCKSAMFNYLLHGWEPGGFLTAVLTNDLYRAALVCDFENAKNLTFVARWVYHSLPRICYGDQARMNEWCSLSDREREQILISRGLLPTLFDVIQDPVDLI